MDDQSQKVLVFWISAELISSSAVGIVPVGVVFRFSSSERSSPQSSIRVSVLALSSWVYEPVTINCTSDLVFQKSSSIVLSAGSTVVSMQLVSPSATTTEAMMPQRGVL